MQPAVGQTQIKPHVPQSIFLRKGTVKTFFLALDSGKTYRIHCEQKGIDVALILLNAAGDTVGYQDSPNGLFGGETLFFTPEISGNYPLQVAPLLQPTNAASGKVVLLWEAKKPLPSPEKLNQLLSPAQMQQDLNIFRAIRQKANSGFYRYRSPASIDSIYQWATAQCRQPARLTDFYKTLLVLTDFEGSNHNSTDLPEDLTAYLPEGAYHVPFYGKLVEGHLVVNNDSLEIPVGSRIWCINGRDEAQLRRDFTKYYTTDGYNQTRKHKATAEGSLGARYWLQYGAEDSFRIVFSRPFSDVQETITLPGILLSEKAARYRKRFSLPFDSTLDSQVQPKYRFRKLTAHTGLLSIRVFDMAYGDEDPEYEVYCRFLDSTFATLSTAGITRLIVDVRNNPGGSGSNSERTFSYLTAGKPFRENTGAFILFRNIPLPQYFNWSSADPENQRREQADKEQYLQKTFNRAVQHRYYQDTSLNPVFYPSAKRFSGKLALLIDENTGSAASHFASYMKGYSNATVFGMETTGGYYGHNGHYPVAYRLPHSGIVSRFSIVWVEQDAPLRADQPYGRGIIPHVPVQQSLADFLSQKDTQLKAALQWCEAP